MAVRVAVLDDYGSVARGLGPWERLDGRVEVEFIAEHLADPAARLAGHDVVVAMRERTAFPRAVLERLPALRLLVTTGMVNASIDLDAARDHGVVVCGTGSRGAPPAELTWALILGLVKHLRVEDAAVRAGGWQQDARGRSRGQAARAARARAPGRARRGRRPCVRHGGRRLEREPAGGRRRGGRRPPRRARGAAAHVARRLHPPAALRPHARPARRTRARAHAPRTPCSSTRRAARSSTRAPSSTRCAPVRSPARAWTSSTSSRCPPATRCAPSRARC